MRAVDWRSGQVLAVALLVLAGPGPASAETELPTDFIAATARQLAAEVAARNPGLKTDRVAQRALVDEVLRPRFDLAKSCELILRTHWTNASPAMRQALVDEVLRPRFDLGKSCELILRTHWADASPVLRQALVDSFSEFVIASYADALHWFRTDTITVLPDQPPPVGDRYRVRTLLRMHDSQTHQVQFYLRLSDGSWYVIDVIVDGVSYVRTWSSDFGALVRQEGLQSLIDWLDEYGVEPRDAGPVAALMSFNIRTSSAEDGANAWDRRADHVAALIASEAPDIVGLQEAQPDQVAFLADRLPAYRHVGRSRDAEPGAGESIPLFFHAGRWALDESEHGTFWLSDSPAVPASKSWGNNFPRVVTWARLVHRQTGRALYVYNLHLDHESGNARLKSADLVNERVAGRTHPDPVVIMGDFNAEPQSDVLRRLLDGGLGLRDSYTETGKGDGTFHAFTGDRSGRRIDFILVSPEIDVQKAAILHDKTAGAYPSDHFPVTSTIRF